MMVRLSRDARYVLERNVILFDNASERGGKRFVRATLFSLL